MKIAPKIRLAWAEDTDGVLASVRAVYKNIIDYGGYGGGCFWLPRTVAMYLRTHCGNHSVERGASHWMTVMNAPSSFVIRIHDIGL